MRGEAASAGNWSRSPTGLFGAFGLGWLGDLPPRASRDPAALADVQLFGEWLDGGAIILGLPKIGLAIGFFMLMRPILSGGWRSISRLFSSSERASSTQPSSDPPGARALRWLGDAGDPEWQGLRLARALWRFWLL